MGQGVAIVDIQSMKIVYANEAIAAMSGYTVEEILDFPSFVALSPPPYAAAMEESNRRRLAGSDEPERLGHRHPPQGRNTAGHRGRGAANSRATRRGWSRCCAT